MVIFVFILLVSTSTMEQSFSTMNNSKTRFRKKMDDDILMDPLILYIKREIVTKFKVLIKKEVNI